MNRRYPFLLWLLFGLFCLRVAGQMLVAFAGVRFLPPMEEWYSGLMPYRWLLPSQFLIIALFARIALDITRGRGFFAKERPSLGAALLWIGVPYLLVMAARYAIRMALYPPERWTGGSIPIFFHWVLAAFLLVTARYHRRRSRDAQEKRRFRLGRLSVSALLVTVIAAAIALFLAWQLAPSAFARRMGVRGPQFAVRIERGAVLTTADGTPLVADIYHPQRAARTPAILVRIPYSKTLSNTLFATLVGRFWAERGYTVVIQGTRGRYQSGGVHYPLRGERQDGLDTLAWVARQPWFDGRLGMWGGSYFGYTQWVIADQENPGPAALDIQLASTSLYGMFYPGGAFSLASALHWALRSHGPGDVTPSAPALSRGFNGFPLVAADNRAGGHPERNGPGGADIPFFNEWVSHPERDSFWAEIDGENRAATMRAPALLMAGWYDPFLPTQLDDFIRIRRDARPEVAAASRLVIGPWGHAETVVFPHGLIPRNYRLESLGPSVAWFDQHLLRRPVSALSAPVRIYVMGIHQWRDEQEWPLRRANPTAYYLHSGGRANTAAGDGRLSLEPPITPQSQDQYDYNPRRPVPSEGGPMIGGIGAPAGIARQNAIEARNDVLVYTSPPLDRNLEVTGPVSAVLWVTTEAPHTDFTAKLVDVHPDGAAYNVCDGILRRRYRETNQPVGPRPVTEIQIELWPTSMVFLKGHRLRLEVSSSNFPRFDRNPNTGGNIATETHTEAVIQTVHHSPATPSRLILPVVAQTFQSVRGF